MPLATPNQTGRHRGAQWRHPSRAARAWPLGLAVRAAGAVARQRRRPHTAAAMGTQQVPGPEGCGGGRAAPGPSDFPPRRPALAGGGWEPECGGCGAAWGPGNGGLAEEKGLGSWLPTERAAGGLCFL